MSAKTIYYSVLAVLAAAGATIAEALGGWDTALQTLVILMAIDYVTGILCAIVWKRSPKTTDGTFESKASLKGLIRKGAVLLVVYVATRLDMLMGTDITRLAVIMFFIANDGLSIVENLGIMGVPMPQVVRDAFTLLRQKSEPAPAAPAPADPAAAELPEIQGEPLDLSAAAWPDGDPEEDGAPASGQPPDGEVLQPYTFGPGDPADEGHEEHPEN